MAAELVETTRLYARGVAAIEPGWIEPIAGQRPVAVVVGIGIAALLVAFVAIAGDGGATGAESVTGVKVDSLTNTTESATSVLIDDVEGGDDAQTDGREANPNIEQIGRARGPAPKQSRFGSGSGR